MPIKVIIVQKPYGCYQDMIVVISNAENSEKDLDETEMKNMGNNQYKISKIKYALCSNWLLCINSYVYKIHLHENKDISK